VGDWVEVNDTTNNMRYYYNKVTRKSTWHEPAEVENFKNVSRALEKDGEDWKSAKGADGKNYFYNAKTRRR
jgi:hypothetical protein